MLASKVMVTQKVSVWGNSLGIRLPQAIIQQVGWQEGAMVTISVRDAQVILSPTKPSYSLDELLQGATSQEQHDELEWGKSVGEETW